MFEFIKKGRNFLNEIRGERYDMVLDLSMDRGMDFLTKMAGIPQRIGFNYKNRGVFLTRKIPFKGYEGKHVVEHYAQLLDEMGIPAPDKTLEFFVPESDLKWAKAWLSENALAFFRPLIAVFHGGGASWGKGAS